MRVGDSQGQSQAFDPTRWSEFRAVVADLDGVVTQTTAIHRDAWRRVFDELLELRRERAESGFEAFDPDADYPEIDGKPRLDGVRVFLASRGVRLAEGKEGDGLGDETVRGIGARKNEVYRELLAERAVPVYRPALRLLRRLRDRGLRLGVVSSSRNCRHVLETARIADLFDERVDGETLTERGLAGKPAPDLFLEAARALGLRAEDVAVIEDSPAGVEAAARAGCALVIGIARGGDAEAATLRGRGADLVVRSLDGLEPAREARPLRTLPDAIESFEEIRRAVGDRRVAVLLDYDGTLTPIVDRPEDAVLASETRSVIEALAERTLVGVVSGRGLDDVRGLVDVPGLWYAGSHGFELIDGAGEDRSPGIGDRFAPSLERAAVRLESTLANDAGIRIERKRFAIAVHYRLAGEGAGERVERAARDVARDIGDLRVTGGKMIVELRPDVDWHKGAAVESIIDRSGTPETLVVPIYVGDDDTDEDGFVGAADLGGFGVAVGDRLERTTARYCLEDPAAVKAWLERLNELWSRSEGGA